MNRILLLASTLAIMAATTAFADFFADFSKGDIRSDFPIRTEGADNNPYYKGSFRLLNPNQSFIEGTFSLDNRPGRAILTLKHLSSANQGSKLDGESPVTIMVNGNAVATNLDPGSHGYVKDSLEITKYVRQGDNTIRIQFENGSTHYWIKWMLIETD